METTASYGLSPDAKGRQMQTRGLPRWEVSLAQPCNGGRLLPQPPSPLLKNGLGSCLYIRPLLSELAQSTRQ